MLFISTAKPLPADDETGACDPTNLLLLTSVIVLSEPKPKLEAIC